VREFRIGYGSARAKFLSRQRSSFELTDAFEETQAFAESGSREFWDSNGGSFSSGVSMGIRNQQWPWFAILARTGREKNATLLLENAGYECYLPLIKFTRQWSDRVREIEMPLFSGYLFCRMNPHNRLPVLMLSLIHI